MSFVASFSGTQSICFLCFIYQNKSVQLMVKDMLSQVQRTPAKSEKGVDEHDDIDGIDAGSDEADGTDQSFRLDDSIAGQVNILVSASRQLLADDTQKQVSE